MRKGLFALVTAVMLSAATVPAQAIQCVPYARQVSGIDLKGDAWMWWSAAAGRYDRGRTPQTDAVMVFGRQGSMRFGHVSVVSKVVNSRMILVDHANWAPVRSAGRGAITKMVPVIDVSAKNDWSKVRVWYEPSSSFGSKVYRADGFVYNPARRTAPGNKSNLHKAALTRTTMAMATMGNLIGIDADFSDGSGAAATAPAPGNSVAVANVNSVAVASVSTATTPAGTAVTVQPDPVVSVAVATGSAAAGPSQTQAAPAVAASVEVNDNLGTAIAVAKASFSPRGATNFMFN